MRSRPAGEQCTADNDALTAPLRRIWDHVDVCQVLRSRSLTESWTANPAR